MTPERWARIKDVFGTAFEQPEAERAAFLDSACEGDAELRAEVERLLAESDDDSLHSPASGFLSVAAELGPGDTVAHYRIQTKLGEGGMGVVYKASDSRLGRSVALKFVKTQFSRRSQREARAVATLNHPNVCTLYDVGPNYLVMEFVDGPTLAERIAQSPIPLQETLEIARQTACALEAAHEKGIVHRDLKPANIKLTPEGNVKVLDFGLAKTQGLTASGNAEDSPTLTVSETSAGMILGTAAYMSPEQANGKPVDKRADIWSFGVVLWEMLTGQPLFKGETVTQTLADVLRGPVAFERLPRETPVAIRNLLGRCLDRKAKNRLRDVGEARIAIESTAGGDEPLLENPTVPTRPLTRLGWIVAAVAIAGLVAFTFRRFPEIPPVPVAPVRFQIPLDLPSASLSPDARKLAYVTGGRLRVYLLESQESRDLTAAVGGIPFWSPDSRFIGYLVQGKLKRIEVTGGSPQTIANLSGTWGGGAWNQDNVIVFAETWFGLFRVAASGGIPVQITALDPAREEDRHWGPSFLPDGRHFLYNRTSSDRRKNCGIYLGSLEAKPEQQSSTLLITSHWQPTYVTSADPAVGYLLFMREDTLMAQPFDNRRMALKGQPVPVIEGVSLSGGGSGGGWAAYSASANDSLVIQRSAVLQPTWYDRAGKVLGTVGEPAVYYGSPVLSPDGTRVAVTKRSGEDANIWLLNLSRDGESTRFTFGSVFDSAPSWSPDGGRIVFVSDRDGPEHLYEKPVNGGNDGVALLKARGGKTDTSWSRDGRFLLYAAVQAEAQHNIWMLPLQGDKKPVPFLISEFDERQPHFSPDSHWVAYTSREFGQPDVYVHSFSVNSEGTAVAPGGKWQISDGGGTAPRWRADGRELYYRSLVDGSAMAVEIMSNPVFRAGKPQPLPGIASGAWDSTADGKRFLVLATKSGRSEPLTVMLNWQAGLKK